MQQLKFIEAVKDLVYYADTCAKILKDNGFPGKAKALENRYMKVASMLGIEKKKMKDFNPFEEN